MEYKIRANIVMSRNLTVEADNLKEAMEKVKDMMAEWVKGRFSDPLMTIYTVGTDPTV